MRPILFELRNKPLRHYTPSNTRAETVYKPENNITSFAVGGDSANGNMTFATEDMQNEPCDSGEPVRVKDRLFGIAKVGKLFLQLKMTVNGPIEATWAT